MGLFTMESLALKWTFLFGNSAIIVFLAYSNLSMKQVGFSATQIGMASLMGIQHLCLPLFGFLGDRFRARKFVLVISTAVLFLITLGHFLPLVLSLPTCFIKPSESSMNKSMDLSKEYFQSVLHIHRNVSVNRSSNFFLLPSEESNSTQFSPKYPVVKTPTPVEEVKGSNYVAWLSILFVFLAITKALFTVVNRVILTLQNVATIMYVKEERASYGSYFMWAHIGASVSLLAIGLLASHIKLSVCGILGDGYHITFVWATVGIMLSSFVIPWFKYEYHKHRVIDWTEVKTILSDFHYIIVLIVAFYIGSCTGFQFYWEFWYINELSGSPTIMGVAGLIRRPLVALWFYLSAFLLENVGDLKTIAASLFLFSVSFLAISLTNTPWLVLAIDLLQAAAYGISYTGLTFHFSKAGSFASSSVILGFLEMVYAIGVDAGSGVMGLLFYAIGSKLTLLCYSLTTAIILVGFLVYIYFGKHRDKYEKFPQDDEDSGYTEAITCIR